MTRTYTSLLAWVVPLFLVHSVLGHPQCLDFRAPFKPTTPLSFCSQYSDLGCCNGRYDDPLLESRYNYIRSKVSQQDWDRCNGFVKELLCTKCSPYAAHVYDAETAAKPRDFPGLCRDYCSTFYDKCYQLVWFFDAPLAAITLLGSSRRFCNRVALDDEDYCYPDLVTNPRLSFNASTSTSTVSNTADCLCLKRVHEDLANPLFARPARDGTGRVFVAEQIGRVHIYQPRENIWRDELFLDFTDKATVSAFAGDERGFLGMAFHPNFASNGRFFVFYSTTTDDDDVLPPELQDRSYPFRSKTIVSEMTVSSTDPNKADPSTEKIILTLFQPFANHNGGELLFGTDGYLYTFHGDGGAAGDPMCAGQNKSLIHGKILRLDVDSDPTKPYVIPLDNPFVNEAGARPEIYAYGVRNIWRCGLDQGDRQTGQSRGRVLCGDVGQSRFEEIDLLKKGANYGWNAKEGFEEYDDEHCGDVPLGQNELPITAYSHDVGKSVTGGVFYRGCENPSLNGQYIYGDYVSRQLFSLSEDSNGVWTNKDVFLCGDDLCQGTLENDVRGNILSFGEDEDGEIYVLTSASASSRRKNGYMFKFLDPHTRNDPELCQTDASDTSRTQLQSVRAIIEADSRPRSPRPPNIILSIKVGNGRRKFRRRKKQVPFKRNLKRTRKIKRIMCNKLYRANPVEKKRCKKEKRLIRLRRQRNKSRRRKRMKIAKKEKQYSKISAEL